MQLLYNKLINNCFIIAFGIVLLLLSLNVWYIYIILILYLIYLLKKDKLLFKIQIFCLLCIIIIFYLIKIYQNYLINNLDTNNITGKIINIVKKEYYQKITIRYSIFKINIYDYDFMELKLGMVIEVDGEQRVIEPNHIPNAFNYKNYFYNSLYIGEYKKINLQIIKQSFTINIFNNYMNKYLDKYFDDESIVILKAFIIGDSSNFNDTFKEAIKTNGIVHLFALSGLHISLFINILEKVFKKIKKKYIIINIFLLIYLVITKFGVSISRAIFTYYLKMICKKLNIRFTSLDQTSLIFICMSIINPYLMYNNGFVLSFFATFIILLINDKLKNKNEIKAILTISFYSTILTFPVIVNINNELNLLSPIINIIMILLVETIILPFSIIVCVVPYLSFIYKYIIKAFILIIEIQANISYKLGLVITFKSMNMLAVIIYYLLIFFILSYHTHKYKKALFLLYIIFLLIININFTPTFTITFLDLYNGEATLMEYCNETILIDTGEGINHEVTSFLKSKGIRTIDYLFITHPHSDHNGEFNYIKKNVIVKNVIKNKYDKTNYCDNMILASNGDVIKTKYLEFRVLNPETYNSNENNNSLVLYTKIKNKTFLFLGDIEAECEAKLPINEKIDVVKVAHHGSNTSTSIHLLNKIRPQYAIIMNGRKEVYSFPSDEVIKRLLDKNVKTYTTKRSYTIILKLKNDKLMFYETRK